MATDNRLLITNLQGVQRMSVSFTEAEGLPTLLDLNGNFLAVTTDTGTIKLFDVSRKEPKPLGSSGSFVDPMTNESLGVIRAISVNADGTRLSILSDRIHGQLKIRDPDSRLHVYDADRDIVDSYDFKPTQFTFKQADESHGGLQLFLVDAPEPVAGHEAVRREVATG